MRLSNKTKRVVPIAWKKLIPAIGLLAFGIFIGSIYYNDHSNILAGMLGAIALAAGGYLAYDSIRMAEAGFSFGKDERGKNSDNKNAIIIFAQKDSVTRKDIPLIIKFAKMANPPKGARLHYVRNLRGHFYELYNNTSKKRLEPVKLPDKKAFPPELFKIPAAMQPYKDALDFTPPTMLQKVAPGILLIAMAIVGFLMVMTGG